MFEQPFDDVPVTTKPHVAAFGPALAGKIQTQHSTRALEKATLVQPVVGIAAEAVPEPSSTKWIRRSFHMKNIFFVPSTAEAQARNPLGPHTVEVALLTLAFYSEALVKRED